MKQNSADVCLIEKGIRPLCKRVLIYNYLTTRKNHPTVEMIYKDLLPESPSLSKTTVYNVLSLFLEKNLVQTLSIEGNELRYDANMKSHGHFKCSKCGKIYDFEAKEDCFPKVPLEGFVSCKVHYYVEGYCDKCAAKLRER